jgi:hypothetical protein
MRVFSTLALAGCTWLALGSQAFAEVQISIHDGRVSLSAKDATVRQILTEWARVGHTQIVNVERITGAPITIELTNVPEQDALDMLLRSLSGYLVAQRAPIVSDASQFDRIIVMPTSAAPRPAASAAAVPPPAPFGPQNGFLPPTEDDESRQQGVPAMPPALPIFNNGQQQPANPRRPGNTFGPPGQGFLGPVPQPDQPATAPAPATPGPQPVASPFGAVSAPGMVAPAAPQPGQVVPQGIPQGPQPRRSPNDN